MPTQAVVACLVVQVQEVATASGVTQRSIVPAGVEPPPGGGDFSVVPVTMSFQGTYEQMQDFLLRTRNLARLITVRSVTYCRLGAGGGEGVECPTDTAVTGETTAIEEIEQVLQVELEAEVYFQPTDVPAGTPPTAPEPPETTTAPEETAGVELIDAR